MSHWVDSLFHWLSVHWGDVVPAWLAVVVAAVFGIQSWCSARRSKAAEREATQQADRATTAAENAAAAAARSAAAEERSATAQETQAQLAQDHADEAQRFPWDIERPGKQDFRLVNRTKTRKYNLAVTGEPVRGSSAPGVFRPGRGEAIVSMLSMGARGWNWTVDLEESLTNAGGACCERICERNAAQLRRSHGRQRHRLDE